MESKFTVIVLVTAVVVVTIIISWCARSHISPEAIQDINITAKQPNILIILADDYGWNDVGYHGSKISTPNLDKLAKSGVILDNYYVQPICTPSRSQLLSGRYQIHTGLQHSIIWPAMPSCLPTNIPTIADVLRKYSYSTHIIGKWHLGFYKKECIPTSRGFDSFYGFMNFGGDSFTHQCDYDKMSGLDFYHNTEPIWDQNGTYSTHAFTTQAEKIVQQHAQDNVDKPLFMYMPFQAVHGPQQVPKMYMKPYAHIKHETRRIYAGMVSAMDEAVGKVVSAYQQADLWDDTILIFSTDNGGAAAAGGNNWPLRGQRGQLFEGGVRGVCFVHSNILKVKGEIYKGLVHISDWFPTLVHAAGGDTSHLKLDGHDVWKAISEGSESPRQELLHNIDPLHEPKGTRLPKSPFDNRIRAALRMGDWKLLTGDPGKGFWLPPPNIENNYMIQNLNLNTFKEKSTKNLWLFNLARDPLEKEDLSEAFPQVVEEMLMRLSMYNATAVSAYSPPDDPNADPALHGGVWGPWRD